LCRMQLTGSTTLEVTMMEVRKRPCLARLYGENGFEAACTEPYGQEHSHHDLTAEEAVKEGKAVRVAPRRKVVL
jgi:hypothetical protein